MIYLASPYSHPDPLVRQDRFEKAMSACATLTKRGVHVFSPIAHWHPIAVSHDLPTDANYWMAYNIHHLKHSSRLFVLELPGWQESIGVTEEIRIAKALRLPIQHAPLLS